MTTTQQSSPSSPALSETITAGFAAQVANAPDNPAVLADDGVATYRELAANATAVAALLRDTGSTGPVALLCRHGVTMISTMLGALQAGRPYVPLDPTFPARRLAFQLTDSGATSLLTDADNGPLARSVATDAGPAPVDADPVLADASTVDLAGMATAADPDATAYLLYTSGSTGTPKGVRQSHRNVVFGARNHIRTFGITPADRTGVLTSFGFDMAVTDTFSALLSGAAAAPIDIRGRGLAHLAGALDERGVTVYHSTPTVYRYLVASLGERALPRVRVVLLGGEEVTARDVRLCRRHMGAACVFVNGYGATEVSFIAQHHLPPGAPVADGVVPIGRPLEGIEVVLLDRDGRESATEGEILARSKHVALGYHGRAEPSAARFGTLRGERTYRTGDLARRAPDGTLTFLGRADRQVKIRGFRVELGEIETCLADLPGVAQAAVVARRAGTGRGETELVGYVVPRHGATDEGADEATIRAALGELLPDYMVPRAVVALAELPLTVTGKLDERALPAPPAQPPAQPPPSPAGAGDELDGVAAVIARTWCTVLDLPSVGRADNFFDLGGHSLLMALVHEDLEGTLGRRIPMSDLFAHPTVGGLAAYLSGADLPAEDAVDAAVERSARRRQARARRAGR
ncbi:MAG: amino acid adenylation domain-containing protein [Actinophytocola sp.]|uniref:non-ribosomal peptide synthetase n=1 Tax=Actinophytocola sp. TaxID=1872138 RepID=UPI001324DCCE|nr:non-ribosomal peptide synthetase [Actinophytocola sp.]MPZ81619.1 amino acid adenylation domain-containing protein [Actinophytocola sp.]